ncbi:hypothetical protein jhhlp_001003 [Lomentospora prolificans]|uniref:Uracil-DNA glycosylase-like domain-containing protein n=1 Tax=Lomentospora prolificans TaxID=41688 RepID=A0A2N3NKB1_9PEZI|nr:hypothetical protein jhhlp_001003 [Lomentospora prolificans]
MTASAEMDMELKPATFSGRLNLQEFTFKDSLSGSPVRRSPRLNASASQVSLAATPARPTPSPTPSAKRKATDSESSPGSPSPTKGIKRSKSRGRSSGYAPPSTYAHLKGLTDSMGPDLLVMMVGLNPGVRTAQTGHAYAHPSNLFWKLMYSSGITTRLCRPDEDHDMPRLFHVGLTNIVARPSRNGAELSKGEMDEGVAILEEKARRWRPEAICFVGKSIWESVWRVRHGRALSKNEFKYGWQDESEIFAPVDGAEGWKGARVFVASSTSGLAATLSPAEKERIWRELGAWVEERRAAREAAKREERENVKDEVQE